MQANASPIFVDFHQEWMEWIARNLIMRIWALMTANEMSSVLTFDQKTFDLVARAALFIFESSGQCIFKGFSISKLDHLAV